MSTTTQTAAIETAAPVKNLRATRKETAAAKKTPAAKPAPAKKAAEPKAKKDGTVYTYEAGPSRAGITNVRSFDHEVVVATDVQDPNHPSKRWQAGVVTRFFSSHEMATRYKERLESEGCNVVLLPVKLISKEA